MSNHPRLGLAAIAAALFAVGGVAGARAAPQRQPPTGSPAVVLDVPDGWTIDRPGDVTLNVFNSDRSGLISLSVETTPPGASLTEFRDNMFKAATCSPLDRNEQVRVGGRAGVAYYCKPSSDQLAAARVVLIRLDDTHIASVGHTYRLDARGADVQALEAVIASARYEAAAR